jgi:hypothetical protein
LAKLETLRHVCLCVCCVVLCRALLLQQQQQDGSAGLPERVIISAGRSRQRDHISGLLRDSSLALLTSWSSPFSFVASTDAAASLAAGGNTGSSGNNGSASSSNGNNGNGNGNNSKLEAPGSKVAGWLLQKPMQDILAGFMRQPGRSSGKAGSSSSSSSSSITADLATEAKLDSRCQEAFAAVKEFESNHCLSVQSMGVTYTAARPDLVKALLGLQGKLGLRDDLVHDAVLLMDRAMSASFKVRQSAGLLSSEQAGRMLM